MAISGDGQVVAAVATGNSDGNIGGGNMRIFRWMSPSWVQVGNTIYGAEEDKVGSDVALNYIGDVVVVGIRRAHSNRAGETRVYRYESSDWVQRGTSITGNDADDENGYGVDVSLTGDIFVTGTPGEANSVGLVEVFQWNVVAGDWRLKGAGILGPDENSFFGRTARLSDDGEVVAVGAPGIDDALVYTWSGSEWVQRGDTIVGSSVIASANYIALSGDGSTLAVSAELADTVVGTRTGFTTVFRWDGSTWSQLGNTIKGTADNSRDGSSLALDTSGNILATSADQYSDAPVGSSAGLVRVFALVDNLWSIIGEELTGEAQDDRYGGSISVSLSAGVVRIAGGSRFHDGGGMSRTGQVRVFDMVATVGTPDCAAVYGDSRWVLDTAATCDGLGTSDVCYACPASGTAVCVSCGSLPFNAVWDPTGTISGTNCPYRCDTELYASGGACSACTVCVAGQWESGACWTVGDRQCTSCGPAPANGVWDVSGMLSSNVDVRTVVRVSSTMLAGHAAACTACMDGEFEAGACSAAGGPCVHIVRSGSGELRVACRGDCGVW